MEFDPELSFDNTAIAFQHKPDRQLRKANLIFSVINKPWLSALAQQAGLLALNWGLPIKGLIRKTLFELFCGGEHLDEVAQTAGVLADGNVHTILDYAVEGTEEEAEFERVEKELTTAAEKGAALPMTRFVTIKLTGIASTELLENIQSGKQLTPEEQQAMERVTGRLDRICAKTLESSMSLLIDAEESWIQDVIDDQATLMMAKYNTSRPVVFNTYQLYRTDTTEKLKQAHEHAVSNGYVLGAKLVRGAYMEKERGRSEAEGYPSPIHPNKLACDQAFNEALDFCVANRAHIYTMCGSHNEYSNHYLAYLMNRHGIAKDDPRFWFAQLYGMSDNISFNLARAGYNVAKYVPYGPVKAVIPYLIRRARENTSVSGQSSRELELIRRELGRRRRDIV